MSRHARSWQAFMRRTLRLDEYECMYSGVRAVNNKDVIEYADGCFQGEGQERERDGDVGQYRRSFDQITRRAMQELTTTTTDDPHTATTTAITNEHKPQPQPQSMHDPTVLTVGDTVFRVVAASFTTICAVARGQHAGLIVERVPFGFLVIVFQRPYTLEQVYPIVEKCCAPLRR